MKQVKNVILKTGKWFKNIVNIFKIKPDEYVEEDFFYDLCPIDNVDDIEPYYNRFMTSVSKGNKSIAFTGQYGVGKTSIINSILKKTNGKYKSIRISLGTLNKNSNITSKELEMKILQQIIYTVNESKLPMSRFKRIRFLERYYYPFYLLIVAAIFFLITTYFPGFFVFILKPVFLSFNNFNFGNIICFFVFMFLAMFCAYLLFLFKRSINITFFKYKDLEIKISQDDKSIFNKYLDEIIYFFQKIKCNLVIIEDLDRYGNISLNVFKQLKELNHVLNSNETIKQNGGLVFVYSLRDNLFLSAENRVKFFDYIIPVVPKFSSNNVKAHIIDIYSKLLENYKNIEIDDNLFTVLSLYIKDRRLLHNIFMEYKVYVDAFVGNREINYTQLFALICYKNINPYDFDERLKGSGDLYNIFDLKSTFIYMINSNISDKKNYYEKKLEKLSENKIRDFDNLKKVFVYGNIEHRYLSSSLDFIYLVYGSEKISLKKFLNEKFNVNVLKNKEVSFKCSYGNSKVGDAIVIKFIEDVNNLDEGTIFINERINFYNKQINENENLSMSQIFSLENIENILNHHDEEIQKKIRCIFSNKLLVTLVRNGYIKENYENDLSYFMKNGNDGLLLSDYNFIVSVDVGDKLTYDYEIKNILEVFNRIEVNDFKKESILNFYICDYLLNSDNISKKKLFFEQFSYLNDYKIKFLDRYCGYNYSNFILLLKNIFSEDIFNYLLNSNNILNTSDWIKAIIENIILKVNDSSIEMLKKYLETNVDVINLIKENKISTYNIKLLDLQYEDYSKLDFNIIKMLYKNNLFISNYNFYKRLLEVYEVSENDLKINDLFYNNINFKKFYDKLLENNYIDFYNNISYFENSSESIIKFLNEKIDNKYKIDFLNKEKNKIRNINDIDDKSLWYELLINKFCKWNLNNLLSYFEYVNDYDDLVLKMLCELSYSYGRIEHDCLYKFEQGLLYAKRDDSIDYINIAKNFTYIYSNIDFTKNVNLKFLDELVNNNKVQLNVDLYNAFVVNYESYLVPLVEKQFRNFMNIKNDVYVNSMLIEDVLRSKISIDNKVELLDNIDLKSVSLDVIELCVRDIIYVKNPISDQLINSLFEVLKLEERIDLFIYLYNCDSKYISFFYKLYWNLYKVRNGVSTIASFDYDERLLKLFEFLVEKNLINSLSIEKKKIKITFPKNKLF